jgi:hypothetical protein
MLTFFVCILYRSNLLTFEDVDVSKGGEIKQRDQGREEAAVVFFELVVVQPANLHHGVQEENGDYQHYYTHIDREDHNERVQDIVEGFDRKL